MRSIHRSVFLRFLAALALCIAVLSAGVYFIVWKALLNFALQDNSNALLFIASNIRGNYADKLRALDSLADMRGFAPFDNREADRLVKRFLEFDNIYSTVHVYRRDGVLLSARKRPSMPAYNVEKNFYLKSDKTYHLLARRVIETSEPAASETYLTSSGDLYQTYVIPFPKGKRPEGIISGGVFPRNHRVDNLIEGLRLSKDNFIVICDETRVFAESALPAGDVIRKEMWRAVSEYSAYFAKFPENKPRIQFLKGGLPYILFITYIKDLKFYVVLGLNTSTLTEKRYEILKYLAITLIISVILSFFMAIAIANRLSKPFTLVVDAVNNINHGILEGRIDYQNNDEIGMLCRQIEQLAEKIKKDRYLGYLWGGEDDIPSNDR